MKRLAACSALALALAPLGCVGTVDSTESTGSGPGSAPATSKPSTPTPGAASGGPSGTGSAPATPGMMPSPSSPPPAPAVDLRPPVPDIKCGDPSAARGIARRGVRRLSAHELSATFLDLSKGGKTFNAAFAFFPDLPEMDDVADWNPLHTYDQALQWALTVDAVAQSTTLPADLGFTCLAQAPLADTCLRDFLTSFGRKAWRRPLTATEVSALTAQVRSVPSPSARYTAVSLLLTAPDFLFHVENGVSVQGARVRLTDHEVANRVSYAAVGSLPDAALAAAADRGELQTLAQVEPHVRRLLESPRGRAKLKVFFSEWLDLGDHLVGPTGQAIVRAALFGGDKYPKFEGPTSQYEQEFWDYVNHVIWTEKGSFRDLMSRRIGFPRTAHMQRVMNVAELSVAGAPIAAPNYPGLLFRPGLLAQPIDVTSPIARGVFVLRRVLCDVLPSPDFTVVNARFNEIGNLDPVMVPNHEIATRLTSAAGCATCHTKINPIGFALEGYDTMGTRRQQQTVFSDKYPGTTVLKTHALPYPSMGTSIDDASRPVSYNGPDDFAAALASSHRPASCALTYLFRHIERRAETQPDTCAINQWAKLATDGKPMADVLVSSIANEDIFWRGAQ